MIVAAAAVGMHELWTGTANYKFGLPGYFVFDRFRHGEGTSTRNHSGLGLGLSIAKQLVDAHSGSIRVESAGTGQGDLDVLAHGWFSRIRWPTAVLDAGTW